MSAKEATPEKPETETTSAELSPQKPKKNAIRIITPILLLAVAAFGVRHVMWSKAHEATDNAQVAADVVQIVPQVSGVVQEILVVDNQPVKKGQLLVQLDDAKLKAAVNQAQANLDAAIAEAQSAGIAVEYTQATTQADSLQSSGGVAKASAGVGSAQAGISAAEAQYASSHANTLSAQADVRSAETGLISSRENIARAHSNIEAAKAQLESAKSTVGMAEASLKSAQSQNDLAQKNFERAKRLEQEGAISRQQLDAATASAESAAAATESAAQQLSSSKSLVSQRTADLQTAYANLKSAESTVKLAQSQIEAARQKVVASSSNESAARIQIQSARESLAAAGGTKTQSLGEAQMTATGSIQIRQREAAKRQSLAKVEQAQAALKTAQLDLEHARVYAPVDGRVSKRIAEIGALAQVGGSLMSVVPEHSVYVVANFKETQVSRIRSGEKVDIEIDAFPGTEFHGHIDSTSAATGATFALLPPDNATGNFVKVVQRVPVKILLDEDAEQLAKLHVGMSAIVTVKVN